MIWKKTTQKTKSRATPTPLKTGCEFMCSGSVGSSFYTSYSPCITFKRQEHHLT